MFIKPIFWLTPGYVRNLAARAGKWVLRTCGQFDRHEGLANNSGRWRCYPVFNHQSKASKIFASHQEKKISEINAGNNGNLL
jgi:hypothetical protein